MAKVETAGAAARLALVLPGSFGVLLLSGALGSVAVAQPYAYVVNVASDDVSVVDTQTNTVVVTIPVGVQPNGVAVSPDGALVYVTNFRSYTVTVIDARSNAVVDSISVGRGPVGVAFASDGATAYVTNRESGSVSVIDTASGTVTATIEDGVGPGSNGIAITPDDAFAYVNNAFSRDPGTVSVIDLAAGAVVDAVEVYRNPKRVAVSPDGRSAYVANFRSWNVSLIDTATNSFANGLRVSGRTVGVAFNPNGAYAYVTNLAGWIEVIETARGRLTEFIEVGAEPYAIAVSRSGDTAYVANLGDDTVSVVNLVDLAVTATVAVGDKPFAVALSCVGAGCTEPPHTPEPFTPRPTRTPTATPSGAVSPTETRTRPPVATRTPDLQAARVRLGAASGQAGEVVEIEASLVASGGLVAGIENVLTIDRGFAFEVCTAGPETGKILFSSLKPRHCTAGLDCTSVKIILLSFSNFDPIPDGVALYTCKVATPSDVAPGSYPVYISEVGASTPDGEEVAINGIDGVITILDPGLLRASLAGASSALRQPRRDRGAGVTPGGLRCSAGERDGVDCADDADCPRGVCTVSPGVCDGGGDDGLLCDCVGGLCNGQSSCLPDAALGTCSGGSSEGACCDRDFNCQGGHPCVDSQRICAGGVGKGMSCLRDEQCPDSECVSTGAFCNGGDFERYACVDDADCPRGACAAASPTSVPSPAASPAGSQESASGSGSGGCSATSSPASGLDLLWLLAPIAALWCRRRVHMPHGRRRPRVPSREDSAR